MVLLFIITFVIYDYAENQVITAESIKVPQALDVPDALKYVRSNLLDILREYQIKKAGIRSAESASRTPNTTRFYIEGVIQETFASSDLDSYFVGAIATISSKVGIERKQFKKYIDGTLTFDKVENWNEFSMHQKEAFFCALGAVNV